MSATIPPAESTQPISQSYYEILIQRGRSLHLPTGTKDESSAETQRSLNEGDQGHVDIVSSFVTGEKDGEKSEEDEEKSENENDDFSPTQSQHNLTQYPESERFKTPATAGRKRDYNGNLVDTPLLPRNPLRNGEPTPSRMMGLSQAFAGTQAGSSPFLQGLPTVARSDRPSPNIDLQTRPASASDSSPWRPLTDFKRAVTEPATRYVPMKQSQAHRDLQALPDVETRVDVDEDDEDDGFNDEPSCVRRTRRRKQREDQANRDMLRISSVARSANVVSPTPVTLLAPVPEDQKTVLAEDDEYITHSESTRIDNGVSSDTETERENAYQKASRENSPRDDDNDDDDDYDKENQIVDVPRTVTARRLHDIINGSISYIDASPLTRQDAASPLEATVPSSALQTVPNSQPGDERKKYRDIRARTPQPKNADGNVNLRSTHGPTLDLPSTVQLEHYRSLGADMAAYQTLRFQQGELPSTPPSSESSTRFVHGSAIPETSSDPAEKLLQALHGADHPNDDGEASAKNTTQVCSVDVSSQPIRTTPPGRRRRRMAHDSAEPSSTVPTPSFNAREALQLDRDEDIMALVAISPSRKPGSHNDYGTESWKPPPTFAVDSTHSSSPADASNRINKSQPDLSTPQYDNHAQGVPGSELGPQGRVAQCISPLLKMTSILPARKSIWEIETTPVESTGHSLHGTKPKSRKSLRVEHQDAAVEIKPTAHVRSVKHPSDKVKDSALNSSDDLLVAPNMVFACYNGKVRAYYPAICLGSIGDDPKKYRIQWEGYDPDEVDVHGVRRLDLRIGDVVKVNLEKFPKIPYLIQGFKDKVKKGSTELTDVRGFRTLLVVPKPKKNLISEHDPTTYDEVPVSAVYLDNNMWRQMKGRSPYLAIEDSDHRFSECQTPIERDMTPNTPSSRRRQQLQPVDDLSLTDAKGLFANMAFAISYEDIERKDMLAENIRNRGGVVIAESFPALFEVDTIQLRSMYHHLGFTALLAESFSRKEKYMQALALGVPCLSGRWIEKCIEKDALVNWQTYLLPAGESTALDGATRSRILPAMPAKTVLLTEIISRRSKLLDGLRVIVVMGRGKAEVKRAKYVFLIHALGAERVEKVPDLKSAQDMVQLNPSYRWVFVDDKDVSNCQGLFAPVDGTSRAAKAVAISGQVPGIVGQETIVQSLILGQWADD